MSYEFRKLYSDVVTPDGTVCVLYFSWVRLLGRSYARGGVEIYSSDGRREIAHGAPPAAFDPEALDANPTLILELDGGGRFVLEYARSLGAWTPLKPACEALEWTVKVARADARARWEGRERPPLEGTGYSDWVRITRFTRWIGFQTLNWGRVHLPDRTVVFNSLLFRSGKVWDVGSEWRGGERVEGPEIRAGVTLEPQRVLHEGDAFDPERMPSALDRFVCNALGGRTREKRFFSRATAGAAQGTALHEEVHFG